MYPSFEELEESNTNNNNNLNDEAEEFYAAVDAGPT